MSRALDDKLEYELNHKWHTYISAGLFVLVNEILYAHLIWVKILEKIMLIAKAFKFIPNHQEFLTDKIKDNKFVPSQMTSPNRGNSLVFVKNRSSIDTWQTT